MIFTINLPYLCALWSIGVASMLKTGWLDRVVSYHRNQFEKDFKEVAPIQLEATLERAPAGYKDSPRWDGAAVTRLLALLSVSEPAAPARRALVRSLQPNTRRFFTKSQSWKLFPSLGKNHVNDIYYDLSSSEEIEDQPTILDTGVSPDDAVLVVRNPVEARLPSARISVKLLREILEARAIAAREMPSTAKYSIPWIPMNKTTTASVANATGTTTEGRSNTTEDPGNGSGTTDAAGGSTGGTAAAADTAASETITESEATTSVAPSRRLVGRKGKGGNLGLGSMVRNKPMVLNNKPMVLNNKPMVLNNKPMVLNKGRGGVIPKGRFSNLKGLRSVNGGNKGTIRLKG